MLPKFNVSPSLIKGYDQVDKGEMCGLFFKASYIDKIVPFQSSPAFIMGQWTEWKMTGALPRDGKEPVPETVKSGELNTQYKRLLNQAEIWKEYCKRNKIENITTGRVLEYEFEGIKTKGIFDVDYIDTDGNFVIIDIKTSGYIDNKWEAMGWKDIENKKLLTIQAPKYVWLVNKVLNIPLEKIIFKFYVVHSNHDYERKIFNMKVLPSTFEWLEERIRFTVTQIEHNELLGWVSTTNYKHCVNCDLRENCSRRLFDPKEENIYML